MTELKKSIETEMNAIKDSMAYFQWEDQECYTKWLIQTYRMVCHSTRLVAYASGLTEIDNQSMHHRFIEHAFEEKSHEILCVNDLKALSQSVQDYPELASTKALYQTQYYLIDRKHPTSLLGYILFLECLATSFGKEAYDRVKAKHGAKAGQFLRVHSEEDHDHVESALAEISKLPQAQVAHIIDNLNTSRHHYQNMLNAIIESSGKTELTNVA